MIEGGSVLTQANDGEPGVPVYVIDDDRYVLCMCIPMLEHRASSAFCISWFAVHIASYPGFSSKACFTLMQNKLINPTVQVPDYMMSII